MKKTPLLEIATLLAPFGVSSPPSIDVAVEGFQIDSRLVGSGELFFALKGEKEDGHHFLPMVRERGGVGAVVSKEYGGPSFGLELLKVVSVREALQGLAHEMAKRRKGALIEITGTVGKTTTKEFIATLLEGRFRVGKNVASYNTQLTFPLTILNREEGEEVWVLEVGMGRPGELRRLTEIAPPDIAVLTKVGLGHSLYYPGGVEEIAQEKGEIFALAKRAVFYHGYHQFLGCVEAIRSQEKVSFSIEEAGADFFLAPVEGKYAIDEKGVRGKVLDVPFREGHLLHNFLAAVAVARMMKMEWGEIEKQVEKLQVPKMRFEKRRGGEGALWINDAYNANPESMKAAFQSLPEPEVGGKRVGVLGAMRELGTFSEEAHREVGRLAQEHFDLLLTFGEGAEGIAEGFAEAKKPVEHVGEMELLKERLKGVVSPKDVVLVKGSRGVRLERVFEGEGCS